MKLKRLVATLVLAAGVALPMSASAWDGSTKIDEGGFFLIATFRVKPDQDIEFLKIMKKVVIDTRNEVGNIDYRLHKARGAPNTYIVYEVFKDKAAADAHNAEDHIKKMMPLLLKTLNGEITVQAMDVVR